MGYPYISEIRPFAFGFAPKGWMLCAGQLLPINQNAALFSLLGTTFGGNGQNTFGLPDLRGRVPVGAGGGYAMGQFGGEQTHSLQLNEMAAHNHLVNVNDTAATTASPSNTSVLGVTNSTEGTFLLFGTGSQNGTLAPGMIAGQGGGQGHPNLMPFGVVSFCMAVTGIFPSRN